MDRIMLKVIILCRDKILHIKRRNNTSNMLFITRAIINICKRRSILRSVTLILLRLQFLVFTCRGIICINRSLFSSRSESKFVLIVFDPFEISFDSQRTSVVNTMK